MVVEIVLYMLGLVMVIVALGQFTGRLAIRRRAGVWFPFGAGLSVFCSLALFGFSATLTLQRLGYHITEPMFLLWVLAMGVVATVAGAFDLVRWYGNNAKAFKDQADEFANETAGWKENPPRR